MHGYHWDSPHVLSTEATEWSCTPEAADLAWEGKQSEWACEKQPPIAGQAGKKADRHPPLPTPSRGSAICLAAGAEPWEVQLSCGNLATTPTWEAHFRGPGLGSLTGQWTADELGVLSTFPVPGGWSVLCSNGKGSALCRCLVNSFSWLITFCRNRS